VDAEEGPSDEDETSRRRDHLIGFIIVSVAAVIVLTLMGGTPILILEVFAMAAILGALAVLMIVAMRGGTRIRWMGRGRQ